MVFELAFRHPANLGATIGPAVRCAALNPTTNTAAQVEDAFRTVAGRFTLSLQQNAKYNPFVLSALRTLGSAHARSLSTEQRSTPIVSGSCALLVQKVGYTKSGIMIRTAPRFCRSLRAIQRYTPPLVAEPKEPQWS
jgi:hypothetical protein